MYFLLILAVAALLATRTRASGERPLPAPFRRALDSRWMPFALGAVWVATIACAWGTLRPQPVFHDEISYVLQAKLFAEGRWSAPSPPMPDMWAQAHVLVAPVMASKYPPGHALLLAVGELLGGASLMVFALAFLRGFMVYVLARRLAGGPIALVTSLLALHGDSLHWGASFFSETTTGALALVCWYALLRWHQAPRTRWLALVALTLGWCAITRPVTALALALPVGAVVLVDVVQRRRYRDLGVAMAIGTAIVAILPLWSARTTGDWKLWPATQYTRDYMPYDYPHFGVVHAAPRRELPPDLAALTGSLMAEERAHTLARAPKIALLRVGPLASATWRSPLPEALLALVGLLAIPAAAWVGVATVATLFFGYLAHPTWAAWTIYYMEIAPVLVFLSTCGLALLLRRLGSAGWPAGSWRRTPAGGLSFLLAGVLLFAAYVRQQTASVREIYQGTSSYQQNFRIALQRMPGPAVLFVRHASWHSPHLSLVTNGPDWERAPVWIVTDHGDARNAALLRLAPGRRAFLYDESRSMISMYPTPAAP